MHAGFAIALLAAAVAAAGGARAEAPAAGFADPGGDRLVMRPPEGWLAAREQRGEDVYEVAYLPAGQSPDDWRQQFRVQVFVHLSKRRPELSAADFAENLARYWTEACEDARASPMSAFTENGYPAAVRLLTCPRNRGGTLGSVSMIKVIRGRASMYLFDRVWRGPAFEAGTMPVEQETLDRWAEFLALTTLCRPDSAEAPCPDAVE